MLKKHTLLLSFTYLIFVSSLVAGEVRLTLETAPVYAVQHNLTLAVARLRIAEAQGRVAQSGRLANPEIELEINRNLRAAEGAIGVSFMQKFPVTARLRLERAISRAELTAVEAEVANAERLLRADVALATVKWLALDGQQALRVRQLGNSRELSLFMQRRLETGEAAPADASLVELETRQLEVEIAQLDLEKITLAGELRPLLGLSAAAQPVITGILPATGVVPTQSAPNRPDLRVAEGNVETAQLNVSLAQSQKWEDIGVGVNLLEERTEDAPEGYSHDTFFGLKFSLVLPFWNKNTGRIQEAEATTERAKKEVEVLQLIIGNETFAAVETMTSLTRLIAIFDTQLLPKVIQIEQQLRDSYAVGQTPLPEVLRARDRRLLLERQRLDALRDYHLARIRHRAALGQNQ